MSTKLSDSVNNIEGVIFTGVYGVGKSSVVEEITNCLDQSDANYGAVDVDWLWWFNNSELDEGQAKQVLLANIKSVISNYLDAGVNRFLFAWSIRNKRDLDALKDVIPFPLKVIGLTAPLSIIEERLTGDAATGRKEDLNNTKQWLQEGLDSSIFDAEVSNNRPILEVANEVLTLLEWDSERHT